MERRHHCKDVMFSGILIRRRINKQKIMDPGNKTYQELSSVASDSPQAYPGARSILIDLRFVHGYLLHAMLVFPVVQRSDTVALSEMGIYKK